MCDDSETLSFNVGLMNKALRIILEKGRMSDNDVVLDAGSGDGRIVGLLAGVFGISTVGVECDHELVQRSRNNIRYLNEIRIIEETKAEIVEGNFNLDKTYSEWGIEFADFSIVFSYSNNQERLAEKIGLQSKK